MVRPTREREGVVLFVRRRRQRRERRLGHPERPLSRADKRAMGRRAGRGGGDGTQSLRPGRGVAVSGQRRRHANPLLPAWRGRLGHEKWRPVFRKDDAPERELCGRLTARYATSRENNSGSTLPPDRTATATLSLTSILPVITAASATAPPGSTTSFNSVKAKATAAATSSSLTTTPAPISERLIAKVSFPGVRAISASQMVPVSAAFSSRRPLRNERA